MLGRHTERGRYIQEPNKAFKQLSGDHTSRYIFAKQFVHEAVVLDSGCGCGYGSKYLADNASFIIGLDIDSYSIKCARKRYGASNLEFIVIDSTRSPSKTTRSM